MTTDTSPISTSPANSTRRYLAPDAFTRRVMNPIVAGLARLGVGVRGARVLGVAGRTTGETRTVPVNPLPLDGHRYLVSPRGHTQWSRNLRAARGGTLRKGRTVEAFTAVELADSDKAPVIRAYLEIWAFEVGKFFDGITKDSTDAELAEVAAGFPVFEIHPA